MENETEKLLDSEIQMNETRDGYCEKKEWKNKQQRFAGRVSIELQNIKYWNE